MPPETDPQPQPTPFEPSTENLQRLGPPPETAETRVQALAPETVAAFEARATEAAIRADLRTHLLDILAGMGDVAARKLLGL